MHQQKTNRERESWKLDSSPMDIINFLFKIILGCAPNLQQREERGEEEQEIESEKSMDETSTPRSEGYEYEVFLSFRGPDTRTGFTSHLYRALVDAGIHTFRDDNELRVGNEIGLDLLRAIHQSKISIPIISRSYAHSKWCLLELAEMLKCNKHTDQRILPIFYDVTPDVVKHQTKSYQEAFLQHEKQFDKTTVEAWRDAVKQVSKLKGWEKDKVGNGDEAQLVHTVLWEVSIHLKKNNVNVYDDGLVGMEQHIEEMTRLLDVDQKDVRLVGVLGMGGIGKTTIAKVVYNKFTDHFRQRCSFLTDIREKERQDRELVELKKKLVHDICKGKSEIITIDRYTFGRMRVLIVLDDVDKTSQLKTIFTSLKWFGSGSRIIVTTRNKRVFEGQEACFIYEPKELNPYHSLQLFSKHAHGKDYPPEDYYDISRNVVSIGGGLPLFLEIVGSFLSGRDKKVWDDTLEKLKNIPDDEVFDKLKISYDALDYSQQQIFLDIACHFIGYSKRNALYMWNDCGFFPENGLDVLLQLSLVKIDEERKLWMHDQLRDLGRAIVRAEDYKTLANRSRQWSGSEDDVFDILNDDTGTKRVETLYLSSSVTTEVAEQFGAEAFKKLSNLRYVRVDKVNLDGGLRGPFPKLRWLSWDCFAHSSLKFINLNPRKLVVLDLSYVDVSDDWQGWGQIKMATNLKVLRLSDCPNLTMAPDFSAFLNLERLSLLKCYNLMEINASIVCLRRLSYFDISDCKAFKKLPPEFGSMESLVQVHLDHTAIEAIPIYEGFLRKLEILSAWGCSSLTRISSIGHLRFLVNFSLNYSGITELPDSIGLLVKLRQLLLFECKSLIRIPDSIGSLVELEYLDLFGCCSLTQLPESIGDVENLRTLLIEGSGVQNLPDSTRKLQKLETFSPWDFSCLEGELPNCVWSLSSLKRLRLDAPIISSLPASITGFSNLETLDLRRCSNIQLPPELKLPISLTRLHIPFTIVSLESVVDLVNLKRLGFNNCSSSAEVVDITRDMSKLTKLGTFTFHGVNNIISFPTKIVNLSRLEELSVGKCKNLRFLREELPSSLTILSFGYCDSLERLPNLSNLRNLTYLQLVGCNKLFEIPGLGELQSLASFTANGCRNLHNVEGLEWLENLEKLEIECCESLQVMADISNLKKLIWLRVGECPKLIAIQGLDALELLQDLDLSNWSSLEMLPNLSTLKQLQKLSIYKCWKLGELIDGLQIKTLDYFQDQAGDEFNYGKSVEKESSWDEESINPDEDELIQDLSQENSDLEDYSTDDVDFYS